MEPSFLLLTYDSCRYDTFRDANTPVLDSYTTVIPAQTPANFTFPAHQAFFVGHIPCASEPLPFYNRFTRQLLGLSGVGEVSVVTGAYLTVESDENVVVGLSDAGYQTVGAAAMTWFRQRPLQRGFTSFLWTGTNAEAQIDFVLDELDPQRPFFAFVNFGETHAPYLYAGKTERCPVDVRGRAMRWPPHEEGPVGRNSPAYAYQVEAIEYLDTCLPKLFARLPGETIVVLCGDHGDCFGEDGYWGHAVSHPKVLEVPLAIFRLDRASIESSETHLGVTEDPPSDSVVSTAAR